jgi:hypothetical protein
MQLQLQTQLEVHQTRAQPTMRISRSVENNRRYASTFSNDRATNVLQVITYMARGIVEAHNGRIWAENNPNG